MNEKLIKLTAMRVFNGDMELSQVPIPYKEAVEEEVAKLQEGVDNG